jgi:hypothetical protein
MKAHKPVRCGLTRDTYYGRVAIVHKSTEHPDECITDIGATAIPDGYVPSDAVVEAMHKAMMSRLFCICQPDRGEVFSFMDDQKALVAEMASAALAQIAKRASDA